MRSWRELFATRAPFLPTLAAATAFYGSGLAATRGDWPAPLDDVFIHFDFARSAASLHPFEWIAGQGYSSGETSPLYALLLAAGYVLGFHGMSLALWAALLACGSLVIMVRALGSLVAPAPTWVATALAAMLVSVGALDWTWFSGMEGAVFCAALAVVLARAKRAREAPPTSRRRAQLAVGLLCAALVWLRPESLLLVPLVAVAVARRALSQSAGGAILRCAGPAAFAALTLVFLNLHATGESASAGAVAKLLVFRPFLSGLQQTKAAAVNLVSSGLFFDGQLGGPARLSWLWPALALPGLLARRTRALATVCVLGSLGWAVLVSWNDAARFQDFRYYVPAVVLLVFASAVGLSVLARRRWGALPGGVATVCAVASSARGIPQQARFFAAASRNIHDQQVEVGRRLAAIMPPGASVLVGDAGAIPYVSGRRAVDALGLGGYDGLPFARAALLGQGATVELIERLSPEERPRFMALYPTWFPDIARAFGREIDRVSIAHNVVCGSATKAIYEADWTTLSDASTDDVAASAGTNGARVVDELDVADVVSESAHSYASPAPAGGFTTFDVRKDALGRRRFDAGRTIAAGQSESFSLLNAAAAPLSILVRTDGAGAEVDLKVTRGPGVLVTAPLSRAPSSPDRWGSRRAPIAVDLERGDVVTLQVGSGTLRDYHVWVATGR